jgi:phage gp45-like
MIVNDSSIWYDKTSFKTFKSRDCMLRVGCVRSSAYSKNIKDIIYQVEILDQSDRYLVPCRRMTQFGGVFNREETVLQTYTPSPEKDQVPAYNTKAGDMVVVAFLGGNCTTSFIIGCLKHSARPSFYNTVSEGPRNYWEFNGIEQTINENGELKVVFKGQPTNKSVLLQKPANNSVPEPTYDENVGTTYYQFLKDGSFTVSDNSKTNPQSILIDKPNGKIVVTSGKIVVEIDKNQETVTCTEKQFTVNASDAINLNTKDISVKASVSAKVQAPKIAIGNGGVELLDHIIKFIDALGLVTAISPLGPCTPLASSPQWASIVQLKVALTTIKGSL